MFIYYLCLYSFIYFTFEIVNNNNNNNNDNKETSINIKEIKLHDVIKDMIIPRKMILHFQ